MKANHNYFGIRQLSLVTVSNGSKILKWKQITTNDQKYYWLKDCFQWFKDTKMKANHNKAIPEKLTEVTVSNGSKILKWKQITTTSVCSSFISHCFQWFKDTKMKANHNVRALWTQQIITVSNGSKILKWKQITTDKEKPYHELHCFQWFKDTKMKANHNTRWTIR